ncbi:hypothetical protein ACGFSB_33915 [Streptomyces sp. NPDC048441]|uniref:transmembrane-type terpene cyclase n=1 Tax=Streptomyces sp. NPDC048441 TaxID=3365552 RepID=UPI0037180D37
MIDEYLRWLPDAIIPWPDVVPVTIPENFRARWIFWTLMSPAAVGWLVAYTLAFHRGHKDKCVGVPALLVAVNFAWEFNLSIILDQDTTQRHINFSWALFNIFIISQVIRWGHKDHPNLTRRNFLWAFVGMFVWSSFMVIYGTIEIGDFPGTYTGTIINIPLSWAFITMLKSRGSSAGQSIYIAIAKMVGSMGAAATVYAEFPGHNLFFVLFISVHILDAVYIRMLYVQIRKEGQSPWAWNRPTVPHFADTPHKKHAAQDNPSVPTARTEVPERIQ